jgi:two-component system, chemotaxis family, CheB/CheR fusion protein
VPPASDDTGFAAQPFSGFTSPVLAGVSPGLEAAVASNILVYPPPPLRVLVADDEPDARAALRELLHVWGHRVCEAATAAQALELAASFRPDVALVGVVLPDMDGLELAARLRSLPGLEGLAVVAVTGDAGPETVRRSDQAGVRYYLVKPVDPVLLRGVLGSIRYGEGD